MEKNLFENDASLPRPVQQMVKASGHHHYHYQMLYKSLYEKFPSESPSTYSYRIFHRHIITAADPITEKILNLNEENFLGHKDMMSNNSFGEEENFFFAEWNYQQINQA
ncbi:hypothetical protein BLA29_003035 [Euroglyphus maynei]|uniref:Uncharacterized protein n=1 Tax=Euroglyphus maynei TaxID=6958 RepID=A0A1Y3BG41_EURMA|nr:hypothetical protein BLA29_003035 [Euroglyphus maynei]